MTAWKDGLLFYYCQMESKKDNRGGKRPGAGQPKKEPTVTISVRVPVALRNELMLKHKGQLNKLISEYLKTLLP